MTDVDDFLIIDNSDIEATESYRIQTGLFFSDFAVVSTYALSCPVKQIANDGTESIEVDYFYAPIPSTFEIKHEVEGRTLGGAYPSPIVSFVSKPFIEGFTLNNCREIIQGTFHGQVSSKYYSFKTIGEVLTATRVLEPSSQTIVESLLGFELSTCLFTNDPIDVCNIDSCYEIASDSVALSTIIVGDKASSVDPLDPAVAPCLIVPEFRVRRQYNDFTLFGGVEVPRVTLYVPPTGLLTVTVRSTADSSTAENSRLINYYECSSIVVNVNNEVDNWYVDVSGFMWPNQYLYEFWNMRWDVATIDNDFVVLNAKYLDRTSGNEGGTYNGNSESVDPDPNALNEQIDYVRFYFDEPGKKLINFNITDGNVDLDEEEVYFTNILESLYFNNSADIRVELVSGNYSSIPNSISLSAVSFYNSGQDQIGLDSSYPNIKWLWENSSGTQSGITLQSLKTGSAISYNTSLNAINNDFVKVNATVSDFYTLSVVNTVSNNTAVYRWSNFLPQSIRIEYDYNNCPINRVLTLSAITEFGGDDILYDGIDNEGNPAILNWFWDTNNINARSEFQSLQNNGIYIANNVNPINITFTDPATLTKVLCSTTFSVSSNIIDPPDNLDSVVIDYDTLPQGFEIDIGLNFETASEIDDTFYRITEDTNYILNAEGKIKPEDSTGWLTNAEVSQLDLLQPLRMFWYFNDDIDNVYGYGASTQKTFDMSTENYHISSLTFFVSCLSASENFGYGHSLSKTVDLKVYKDSFIPDVKEIIFPEYYFRNPSSPEVISLRNNASAYWTETPYPSSYGEGKTLNFFASAFSDDYSGVSWQNFYTETLWYLEGFNDNFVTNDDQLLEFLLTTQQGVYRQYSGVLGAFNDEIGLLNQLLSTYKDDIDGTVQTFKNWKQIDDNFLVTNYEDSSSQEITFEKTIIDPQNLRLSFNLDIEYPNYSPVREASTFRIVNWSVVSDTGEDFSGSSSGSQDYSIQLSPQTNLRTLTVSAEIETRKNVPNQLGLSLDYPFKDAIYETDSKSFDVSVIDFELVGSNSYDIIDNNTLSITAFSPTTINGVVLTNIASYDYEWVVDGVSLGTNTPLTTSIDGYSLYTSSPDYLGRSSTITLNVDGDGLVLSRTKTLQVNPPNQLDLRIFADSLFVKTSSETYFYNDSKSVIPLDKFIYQFDDEEVLYELDYGETFYKSFDTNGSKNLLVTAIDVKGFVYENIVNNIVNVIDDYETYVPDQFTGQEITIKNKFEDFKIQSNEWTVASVFNDSISKIYDNLIFLENVSKFYSKPPTELLGWYGRYQNAISWNLNPHDENYNFVNLESGTLNDLISFQIIDKQNILLAYKNKIEIRTNSYDGVLLESKSEKSINDEFIDLKNVVIDSEGKIIALDSSNFGTVIVYEYNNILTNPFKFIATFGGLGGPSSKSKFRNPNDLTIDHNDILYISDTGNRIIKKFTNTGGFLGTLSSSLFNETESEDEGSVDNGSVISASNGRNDIVYALTNKYVILFDNETNEVISNFEWVEKADNITPRKIVASADDNILYIVGEEKVAKFTKDGLFIGFIGEVPQEYQTNISSIKYVNAFHDDNRIFHLISENFVLKYVDLLDFLYIKPELQDEWWNENTIKINENEFVDYWVYNKVLSRLWENFEMFRQNLFSRVLFSFDINGKLIYNLYRRDPIYKPPFTYSKNDVLIGVNEIVSSEVINRSLERLHQCSTELLDMITSQQVRYRWLDTIEVGFNPLTWYDAREGEKKEIQWAYAIS